MRVLPSTLSGHSDARRGDVIDSSIEPVHMKFSCGGETDQH